MNNNSNTANGQGGNIVQNGSVVSDPTLPQTQNVGLFRQIINILSGRSRPTIDTNVNTTVELDTSSILLFLLGILAVILISIAAWRISRN